MSPDIEPDAIEDVSPDVSEDVLPDASEDVVDAGSDVLEDVSPDVGPQKHEYTESEPNDFDNPIKVELEAEITGKIDEPVYDPEGDYYINDLDFFEFEAKSGEVIRFEVNPLENMDITPVVIVVDSMTGGSTYYRAAVMNINSKKGGGFTAFIPRDGKYMAVVGEYTNFGNSPANVGGDKYGYLLTIKYSNLSEETLDLSSVPKQVSKTMAIDIPDLFVFNVGEEKYVKAETTAVRLDTPSDINTILTLYNKGTKQVIEVADDIDANNGITDSLLLAYTGDAGDFYLISEAILYTDQSTDYDLNIDFLPMDVEVEPNDSYLTASAIRIPSETAGTIGEPKDGEDENGNPIKVGDVDNFYFYGKPGELYRFSIIAENGQPVSNLDSFIAVYQVIDTIFGPYPIAINLNDNSKGKDSMAEALISEEGKYYVMVMDTRNTSDNQNPVGGADYNYKIKAEKINISAKTASPQPYTETSDLNPAGAYKFYKFSGVKGDKFTIDVYQANGSKPEFVPYVVLYDADTYKVIDGVSGDENDSLKKATLNRISVGPQNYLIAILDQSGEGGTEYKYVINISKIALPYYDETEPNDEVTNANETKEKHSLYFGTVDGDGKEPEDLSDMYKFNGTVGQILNVSLSGGPGTEVYDTVISILDSDSNVLASNEDYGNSYYSAIYGWAIPYDGTFYIKVAPQTDYGPVKGSYVLEFELIDGCLASTLLKPQAGDIVINEYYVDYKDDVNGDGVTDKGDQFIELVNTTDKDLLIELNTFKVAGTEKYKFPCGVVLPANKAAVIFGGGAPDGFFGGSQVFVAKKGLDLPGEGNLVDLQHYEGNNEIAKVSYDPSSALIGESFTRDPDITGDFVKHSSAAGADGAKYSPGARVDGLPFTKGFVMKETEPNNDRSDANSIPAGNTEISVYGNLKFEEGANDNDLDDYFKITLQGGQKISIRTKAGIPPEVEDTTLVLFDSNGVELIRNEDIDYLNYYSEIVDYEITADGDYYIDVKAEDQYGSLPGTGYLLEISIK